ncbi:hypothetical protein CIB93_08810 [Streptomyces sp. WZ.A104]|uniref:hypothetical protein n=1 Tax=Streptomyces sp. WZ.A104 TaxID=2023771 RepID=UPI000BBCC3BA|nr:hypothetical protein [Streptomyces sp. WZ.A104]PCG86331.1 hypothetical protein CIB93_08810 [Streptomyces sp. WZ.A104]
MTSFWTLKRLRTFIRLSRQFERSDESHGFASPLAVGGQPTARSVVRVSLLGFRAEAEGKSGFAALSAMRAEHPVIVHLLYAYTAVLVALAVAVVARLTWW